MYAEQVSFSEDDMGPSPGTRNEAVSAIMVDNLPAATSSLSSEASSDSSDDSDSTTNSSQSSHCTSSSDDSSCSESDSSCSESDSECVAQKLFQGSDKTTDEAILALMDLFIKRRWKVCTLKDILKFCADFFPSNMPKSVYKIFQFVENLAPDNYGEICHYYCGDCRTKKQDFGDKCQVCDSTHTGVFYEFPLTLQIKHYFEQRNLASLIDLYQSQITDDNIISDITSSIGYKELKALMPGIYDITLLFNTDGISPSNSSEAHLYPILATICELPPHLRPRFMLVCGLWYDLKFAPAMNDFLTPFVNSLIAINEDKIAWVHPTSKKQYESVVVAPVSSADALARADILVMSHPNGKYGCNRCEQKTKRFKPDDGGRKLRRYLFQEEPARLRDQVRMEKQGCAAVKKGCPVKGIKGEAVVSKIPYFNRAISAIPEYMHSVLLGVVKQFFKLWFQTPGDWNLKGHMEPIDKFICEKVKVTDEFTRVPKGIKTFVLWKASDLRVWLLFISLVALKGHLKEKYYQHFMLLVSAVYILLKEKITMNDIINAKTKLRIFVRDIAIRFCERYFYKRIYRLNDYTYNVHNLLHLAQCVKQWGPLWATAAFNFEAFNHILGELSHGPKHKGKQIINKIKLAHGIEILRNKVGSSSQVPLSSETNVLGLPVVINLDLTTFDIPNVTEGYLRANVKGTIFTTKQYDEKLVRVNSYVCFRHKNSIAYGQILYFLKKDSVIYCLIEILKVDQQQILSHNEGRFSILHLLPICRTGVIVCCSALSLLTKHGKVGDYLCIRPNSVEKNL